MRTVLLGTALTAGLFAGAASASSVYTTYQSPGGVFGVADLSEKVTIATAGPGFDGEFSAGMYHMTGGGGYGDFLSFCVDLGQYLHNGTTYTTSNNLLTGDVLSNIGRLFTTALGTSTMADTIDTSTEAAGFQVALWEIISDTTAVGATFDLDNGNFIMSGNASVTTQAEIYLNAISGNGVADDGYDITFYYSSSKQDVVSATPSPHGNGPTPVPLPATGLLLAFGISSLAAAGRRRRKAS